MTNGQQSDEQYLRELYERFVSDIMNNINSEFYSRDELLDIYDFAQDENDEFAQFHVLLAGARLHPDSNFLDERKAFFLSAVSPEAAHKMLDRKGVQNNDLWEVLRLSLGIYPNGSLEEGINQLLLSGHTLSCEASIQLIDLLRDLDRLDLLAENIRELTEKSDAPDILCFDAAETLNTTDEYRQLARDLAESLTVGEPFCADNWVLLAKTEFGLHRVDETLSAIDYALAIEPENSRALLMKGVALVAASQEDLQKRGKSKAKKADAAAKLEEGIQILRNLLKENPDNGFATKILAEAYATQNKHSAAVEVLAGFMETHEANAVAIIDIMRHSPKNPERYFEIFNRHYGPVEKIWIDTAAQIDKEGNIFEATQMLEWYNDKYGLLEGMEFYLTLLYRSRQFQKYIDSFTAFCALKNSAKKIEPDFSINAYLMVAASYLMLHDYDSALQVCQIMLAVPPVSETLDDHLRWKGTQVTITLIRNLANSKNALIDMPDFDPLTFEISTKR